MSIMQRLVLQTLETIAGSILSCRLFSAFCPDQGRREMMQRYAEDTVEGIIHRLVSNTEVKGGSLLAAVKSVCEKFQWNINEQQDATEFYMRYSFDAFLSENSLSTGFTVKVSGECRKCSRVVTSESSMYTVLTIPICSDISGDI